MKKERIIKKILAIFILLIMLSTIGLIKNEVKAANYSSKFTTISIPNKYEKSYSGTDEDSEYESYIYYDVDYFYITYNVYERFIVGQTIYTQASLNDKISIINEVFNPDYNITYYHKELVEVNGCKGMRIAYRLYNNS